MTFIPYSLTPDGISFVLKGRSRVFAKTHERFADIKAAVYSGDVGALEILADITSFIARITNGDVKISSDEVRWKDGTRKVPKYLASRILEHVRENEPIDPILRLTEKLMENPNLDILEDLYRWIEVGTMPIAEDGDIIAFKKVGADYMSIQANRRTNEKVNWAIGQFPSMPREDCDEDRNNTCSTGLHFCSYGYLKSFGSGGESRVIIVKINPKDITAIPTDYNNTKGRCCKAEVIGEVPEDEAATIFGRVVKSIGTYNPQEPVIDESDNDDSWDSWDENDEDDNDGDAVITSFPVVTTSDFRVFKTSTGKTYTYPEVQKAVTDMGPSKAAEFLGVPRSTLSSWRAKLAK